MPHIHIKDLAHIKFPRQTISKYELVQEMVQKKLQEVPI